MHKKCKGAYFVVIIQNTHKELPLISPASPEAMDGSSLLWVFYHISPVGTTTFCRNSCAKMCTFCKRSIFIALTLQFCNAFYSSVRHCCNFT